MELVELKEVSELKNFFQLLKTYQQHWIFPYLTAEKTAILNYLAKDTFIMDLKTAFLEVGEDGEHQRLAYFKEDQKIIGFVSYRFFPYRQYLGWIYDFSLLEKYQHQGKGTTCLALVEKRLVQLGAEKFQMTCISPQSKSFFVKNGYEKTQEKKEKYFIYTKNTNN